MSDEKKGLIFDFFYSEDSSVPEQEVQEPQKEYMPPGPWCNCAGCQSRRSFQKGIAILGVVAIGFFILFVTLALIFAK